MSLLRYVVTEEEKREMHLQQGREEGRLEGREEERAKAQSERAVFIRNLKAGGVPIDKIVMASGLTAAEIEAL